MKFFLFVMKLFSIIILYKDSENGTKILKSKQDLASFGYFQRGKFVINLDFVYLLYNSVPLTSFSICYFMEVTSKILVERTQVSARLSVKEQEYLVHIHTRYDGLACVIISDEEYPNRVAHTIINKVLEDFSKEVPSQQWTTSDREYE